MSKDFFKVKKGLNIQPTDPSTLESLEDGDIIIDSTDDNRMKVYDSAGGDFTSVGTGGTSGNFLTEFEKLTPDLSNVTSVVDTVTFLPIDDNNKSVKATWAASAGYIQYESAVPTDVEGQGLMTVWLKTSVQGLTLSTTTDGVVQSSLSVIANNKWKQYEIPYVIGGTEQGFRVEASSSVTGDVFIDEAFVGLAPAGFVQSVSQAQFVGSLHWNATTNCIWTISSSTFASYGDDPDCDDQPRTIEGSGIADSSAGLRPEFQILNARTDGLYRVSLQGDLYKAQANNNTCRFRLTGQDNARTSVAVGDENGFTRSPGATFDIKFDTTGNKTINVQAASSNNTDNCHIDARGSNLKFSVHFFPDSSQHVVFQETELTAQTANELTAYVNSAGNLISSNYDWLTCVPSTSPYTCNFNANVFSQTPSCVATASEGTGTKVATVTFVDSSSITVKTYTASTGSGSSATFKIHCSKQGTDVNKSQVVAGKFEQIKTNELVRVRAKDLVGATSTTSFAYNYVNSITELEDNYNALSDTGNIVFTAPKDSYYNFDFGARLDGVTLNEIECGLTIVSSVTGTSNPIILNDTNNASTSQSYPKCFFSGIKLAEGDTVTFYVRKGGTSTFTWNTDSRFSYLKILEHPDTEAIVKNLNDNNNVECQTKFIPSTNITSTGVVSALTFNNLTVGKRYEIKGQYDCTRAITTISSKRCEVQLRNSSTVNTNILISSFVRVDDVKEIIIQTPMNKMFTAQDTVVEFAVTSLSNAQIIGVTDDRTFLTLCELPDSYVETTKFD